MDTTLDARGAGEAAAGYPPRRTPRSPISWGAVVEYCLLHPGARIVCIREAEKTLAQSAKLLIENNF
jgi:hypothetical protein